MKKSEIVVGGKYIAKVNGKLTTVQVDNIREMSKFRRSNYSGKSKYGQSTVYDVTNLTTGRKTTFRSAAKFRQAAKASETPMMKRWKALKKENPGSIILFRMGDFYETFFEDAETAADVLGLTLTSREKKSENPIPMAGFPYHMLGGCMQKLVAAGYSVAIADVEKGA